MSWRQEQPRDAERLRLADELKQQKHRDQQQREWERRGKECPIQRVDWWR